MSTLALWLTSIFHLLLGLIVYKNGDSKSRLPFFILTSALFVWVFIFGYIYVAPSEYVLILTKFVPIPTVLIPITLSMLVHYFPKNSTHYPKRLLIIHSVCSLFFLCVWMRESFISSAHISNRQLLFEFGPLYLACMVYIQGSIIYSFIQLFRKLKSIEKLVKK
jgi:hypothetical protein